MEREDLEESVPMTYYYKATRPDGTDFRTGTVKYEVGKRTRHPASRRRTKDDPSTYLSVSTVPTDCVGMRWPCRLFRVRGVGKPLGSDRWPNKRAFLAVDVLEELPAHQVFGPQGEHVVRLIEQYGTLTSTELNLLYAAHANSRDIRRPRQQLVAFASAWRTAQAVGRESARQTAYTSCGSVAIALVLRDLIGDTYTQEHYDLLTRPWRKVVGSIHPDDKELA